MRSCALNLLCAAHHRMRHGYGPAAAAAAPAVAPPLRAAGAPLDCAGRQPAGGPAGIPVAAPASPACIFATRLFRPRADRCRCAHARRCRNLPSTISCRFRRSHPSWRHGWTLRRKTAGRAVASQLQRTPPAAPRSRRRVASRAGLRVRGGVLRCRPWWRGSRPCARQRSNRARWRINLRRSWRHGQRHALSRP